MYADKAMKVDQCQYLFDVLMDEVCVTGAVGLLNKTDGGKRNK